MTSLPAPILTTQPSNNSNHTAELVVEYMYENYPRISGRHAKIESLPENWCD